MPSVMSSIPILEAYKKRKRAPKLHGFHTFCDPGCPIKPTGPFRENIRVFLQECAELEDYSIGAMPVWCTLLVQEDRGLVVPLYTVEESVEYSEQPFCDHCRCSGWSHHFLSRRKYHLIIPIDSAWNEPLSDDTCELHTHLLHGLIHCNGFGHLLCINGIEGGSKYLCGREIMDLWDRICSNLHIRKITVDDVSKKRSMSLRLLHGVAYGHPWFGRWGYGFYHGSFGVAEHHYDKAIEVLSSMNLDDIILNFPKKGNIRELKQIIYWYRNLSDSNLSTMRDLLRCMLTMKSKYVIRRKLAPVKHFVCFSRTLRCSTRSNPSKSSKCNGKPIKCRRFASVVAGMDSRWPKRRLEYAAEVIVNALKENKENNFSSLGGMTRQDVRDAARLHIGDTGLLDYVLKSMNDVIIGDFIVRRTVNPMNRILEYTIEDVRGNFPSNEEKPESLVFESTCTPVEKPRYDVCGDIYFLYENVLLGSPETEMVGLAARVVMDSKRLVKEWPFRDENDHLLRFFCRVLPNTPEFDLELSPGELISIPLHATYADLKQAAQEALRDTYCIMDNYVVHEIESMDGMVDEEVVFGEVQSGSEIMVRGSGLDLKSELRYEGGPANWIVRCQCGARDDDGERMVSCDICEVWQHTRCSGIEDSETVPPLFVCHGCCSSLMPPRAEGVFLSDVCI